MEMHRTRRQLSAMALLETALHLLSRPIASTPDRALEEAKK
jgi:hypothetical protein